MDKELRGWGNAIVVFYSAGLFVTGLTGGPWFRTPDYSWIRLFLIVGGFMCTLALSNHLAFLRKPVVSILLAVSLYSVIDGFARADQINLGLGLTWLAGTLTTLYIFARRQ
jgi:hypothetical protein